MAMLNNQMVFGLEPVLFRSLVTNYIQVVLGMDLLQEDLLQGDVQVGQWRFFLGETDDKPTPDLGLLIFFRQSHSCHSYDVLMCCASGYHRAQD